MAGDTTSDGRTLDEVDLAPLTARVERSTAYNALDAADDDGAAGEVAGMRGMYRVVAGTGIAAIIVGIVLWLVVPDGSDARAVTTLIVGGSGVLITGFVLLVRSAPSRAYRIARFAERNGLAFTWLRRSPGYEGMPFAFGNSHRRWMIVSGRRGGRPIEIGNLSFTEGEWRRYGRRCGYVAIRLPGRLPHMILDAGHSNGLLGMTLPQEPRRDQQLDVGAGRAFRLYVAEGAQTFARALFTPDAVSGFVELAKRYDVEILGDCLFLYSRTAASTTSPRRWLAQLEAIDTLGRAIPGWAVWDLVRSVRKGSIARIPRLAMGKVRTGSLLLGIVVVVVLLAITALIVVLPSLI